MTKFELERIENIKNNGELLVNEIGGNWDLYFYNDIVWAVPKVGSGAGLSIFCGVKSLKSHLQHLKYVCNRSSLIPDYWQIVNNDFFVNLGIIQA